MTDLTNSSDDDLLRRSASGDEEAFIALYRRRQVGIYRFALNMSGSAAVAEEVTQEVFMTVIRDGARFDAARGSAVAYLFGIARNYVLRSAEQDRHYVAIDEENASAAVSAAMPSALADLTRIEAIDSVRQAVLSLPPAYREAIVLCDLEEMSYTDAAAALNVPIGTVRSRLNRGRAMLLDKLKAGKSDKGFDVLRCFA